MRLMLWLSIFVQLAVPLALIGWLTLAPGRAMATWLMLLLTTGLLLAGIALIVPGLVLPWWLPRALGVVLLAGIVIRFFAWPLSFECTWPTGPGGWLFFGALVATVLVSGVLLAGALDGRRPPATAVLDLPSPLGPGTYLVANGGSREIVNGHLRTLDPEVEAYRGYRGQSYGIDLVAIDALGFRADGLRPEDPGRYEIYGRPVYAPCDGTVIRSRNDRPDMPVPVMDKTLFEGNHVLLRCDAFELLLAHLVPGSVRVSAGDVVGTGMLLGEAGNSGNSSEPHLHVSAQRPGTGAGPLSGEPVPLRLGGRYLVRNDRLKVAARPAGGRGGLSDDGLVRRFQAELDAIRRDHALPGATAAFVLADGTLQSFATGLADVERGRAMTPETPMLAASIGKTFVGATLVALAAEGRLTLDDPLSDWLSEKPWFPRLPNHADITLRQLASHTSGLPDHVHLDAFGTAFAEAVASGAGAFTPDELVGFVLDEPPLFQAGRGWAYSDSGFILLGMVIEQATGNGFYDEVGRRFLAPLSLDSTVPSNQRRIPGLAVGYTAQDNALGLPPRTMDRNGELAWHPATEWTGGGFASTAGDLARWAWLLFGGEAMQGAYLDDLLDSVPMDGETPGRRYGLGVAIYAPAGAPGARGHSGWIPGYVSFVRYLPDRRLALAFQANTDDGLLDGDRPAMADIEARLTRLLPGRPEE